MPKSKKKPVDISKAKASDIFFPPDDQEKEQVDDNEEGSAQEEDAEDENGPDGSGGKKMDTSEIDASNLLGSTAQPPPKRKAAVAADANLLSSPKKPKIVKEETVPTSDTCLIKAMYKKICDLERTCAVIHSIAVRNTEQVVDLTRLEGKLDAAIATPAAVPVKIESSAVDAKASVAFVESAFMTATTWPNFGGNAFWISKQRAALGPHGATEASNSVRFFFFLLLCFTLFFFQQLKLRAKKYRDSITSKIKDKHTYTDGKGKKIDLWKKPEDQASLLAALALNGAYRVKGKDPLGSGKIFLLTCLLII